MGWSARNLTQQFGAPPAFSGPVAYLFASEQTRHVVYRSGNDSGHLIELYCGTDDVWHPKDITDESGGAPATSDPSAYAFEAEGSQHVAYLSGEDGHIHELYQADGWHPNDLMDSAGTVARAVDAPHGWASTGRARQQVVFRDEDRRLHLLTRGTGDGASWSHTILSRLGGPTAAEAPAGYAFDAQGTQHITYTGDDRLLHEYVQTGGTWAYAGDLGPNVGASEDSQPYPVGYGFGADGTRHVPWAGDDGDVHEFSSAGGPWTQENLTVDLGAVPPARGLVPAGYAFEPNPRVPIGTRHVVYTGQDGIVYEFWNQDGRWHVNPLTGTPGSFSAGSAPTAFADPAQGTQNVFYRSTTGDVIELRYTPTRFARPVGTRAA